MYLQKVYALCFFFKNFKEIVWESIFTPIHAPNFMSA